MLDYQKKINIFWKIVKQIDLISASKCQKTYHNRKGSWLLLIR